MINLHLIQTTLSPFFPLYSELRLFYLNFPPIIFLVMISHIFSLNICNFSFCTADVPQALQFYLLVSVPKPGQDNPTTVPGYWPICLQSCVGKLMDRFDVERLTWFLRKNNTFLPHQFGFCLQSGTILLEHNIQLAFRTQPIVHTVFIDLHGAFERAFTGASLKVGLTRGVWQPYAVYPDFLRTAPSPYLSRQLLLNRNLQSQGLLKAP